MELKDIKEFHFLDGTCSANSLEMGKLERMAFIMKLTAGFITFLTLSQTVAHASNLELQDAKDSALHTGSMLVAIAGTQVLQEMAHVADNRKDNTHKKNG